LGIKKIKNKYYEQIYAHKFYNHDKMNAIARIPFGIHTRRIHNLNRPLPMKDIESIINSFPKQKTPVPDWFTDEWYL
jgi:hypothetical protein